MDSVSAYHLAPTGSVPSGPSRSHMVDGDDVVEEEFFVPMHDDVKLACVLQKHPRPIHPGLVLLLHGRLHTKDRGPLSLTSFPTGPQFPFNTLRFDARGMGESEGVTGYSNAEEEAKDLSTILRYIRTSLAPPLSEVISLIGHSKGAVVLLLYACTPSLSSTDSPVPPFLVNVSGRYESAGTENRFATEQMEKLEKDGQFVWMNYRVGKLSPKPSPRSTTASPSPEPDAQAKIEDRRRPYVVTKEALLHHSGRSMNMIKTHFPPATHVLTLHGKADGTVPQRNALLFDEAINSTSHGLSDLILLEGVKHNWDGVGEGEMLVNLVAGWLRSRVGGEGKEGARAKRLGKEGLVDHLGQFRSKAV